MPICNKVLLWRKLLWECGFQLPIYILVGQIKAFCLFSECCTILGVLFLYITVVYLLPMLLELGINDAKLGIVGRHWLISIPLGMEFSEFCCHCLCPRYTSKLIVVFSHCHSCFSNAWVINYLSFGFSSNAWLCEFKLPICSDRANSLVKEMWCDFLFLIVDFFL